MLGRGAWQHSSRRVAADGRIAPHPLRGGAENRLLRDLCLAAMPDYE